MLFVLNQFTAVSHPFCKISKSSVKSFPHTYIVLSSAEFARSASLMKRPGLRIDPWDPFHYDLF